MVTQHDVWKAVVIHLDYSVWLVTLFCTTQSEN